VQFLSKAASNAAAVEQMALQAGLKKGGAAKGELVLAIFELANCFRHGWGIGKDPVAAKQVSSPRPDVLTTSDTISKGIELTGYACVCVPAVLRDRRKSRRYG